MSSLRNLIVATGFSLLLTGSGSQAADMSDLFLEPLLPVEIGSAWYLRGDIGYKLYTTPDITYSQFLTGTLGFTNTDVDGALIVGVGAGYKFNQWFRTDVTIDYETPADVTGRHACLLAVCGLPYNNASGEISAWTILANAYFDLGTWQGITPYVGGGIGTSNVQLENYASTNPPLNPALASSYGADANVWNFAWALTAGASIDIAPNWLLDANYRYVDLGDVSTRDQWGGQIKIDDIAAHEFRMGVRFLLD